MRSEFTDLRSLRQQLVGYSEGFVSRHARIDLQRFQEIEAGADASLDELDRLAALYGVEAEQLEEFPTKLAAGDWVAALPLLDEFKELGDLARHRIIEASSAARDLVKFETLLDPTGASRASRFIQEFPKLRRKPSLTPHRDGARLAGVLRRKIGLGSEPIESMRDFVREQFPAIRVLYSRLGPGPDAPAGLAFAGPVRGPSIVLNVEGKNSNPTARRFSLAHELCHLLVDWNRQQPLVRISGYFSPSGLEDEQRANAFAVRLLCPETVVHNLDGSANDKVSALARFGLHYSAIRLYLRNEGGTDLPRNPSQEFVQPSLERWDLAERESGIEDFPIQDVPIIRRTHVATVAAQLYSEGSLQRDVFARALGVTPDLPLEQVLDYFGFEWPSEVE